MDIFIENTVYKLHGREKCKKEKNNQLGRNVFNI